MLYYFSIDTIWYINVIILMLFYIIVVILMLYYINVIILMLYYISVIILMLYYVNVIILMLYDVTLMLNKCLLLLFVSLNPQVFITCHLNAVYIYHDKKNDLLLLSYWCYDILLYIINILYSSYYINVILILYDIITKLVY